jgi:alpha-beta hydrolase superfamily lysophospholipase
MIVAWGCDNGSDATIGPCSGQETPCRAALHLADGKAPGMESACSSYQECGHWRAYLPFLPADARLTVESEPVEERWDWQGCSVHLDRYRSSGGVKAVLLHGGGGYGRMLSPLGAIGAREGIEVVAPDLPGYGLTTYQPGMDTWGNWVHLVADLVAYERDRDDRPVVLFGASMGGLLALHAAAASGQVAGVIATMLLDPRESASRRVLGPSWAPAWTVPALLRLPGFLTRIRLPIRLVSNMAAIANDPALATLCGHDPHGGGSWVSLAFLQSFLQAAPPVPYADFDTCPVLLVHPENDRWTPVEHSLRLFDQLGVAKRLVMLESCGHFPIEEPGVTQLGSAVRDFLGPLQ